jgi:hypothetical protein
MGAAKKAKAGGKPTGLASDDIDTNNPEFCKIGLAMSERGSPVKPY